MAQEIRQSDFSRTKDFSPPVPFSRSIAILAIIASLICGTLVFFVPPYFIFGPIILLLLVAVILKYPVLGIYFYMLISYLRPQDLFGFLVILRPHISLLALTVISLIIHRKLENRAHLTLMPNDKMFLALLMAAVMSNLTSIWVSYSIETTIELLKTSVFYFAAIALLDNRERLVRYVTLYICSIAVVSLIQIYTYLTVGMTRITGSGGYGIIVGGMTILGGRGPMKGGNDAANGVGGYSNYFFANASELGLGLCLAIPLCYYLFKGARNRLLKALFFVIIVMFLVSIIFSGSRGAFVALVATIIFLLYREKKLLIGLVVMAILSAPILYAVSDQYVDRIKSIGEYDSDESVGIRFRLWSAAIDMVADHPLFGVGTGNFPVAYGSTYRAKGSANLYWSPHNVFIQIVTELGLVGITIYLLFIAAIFWINMKSRRLLRNIDDARSVYYMSHGVDIALVAYIVAGQFITATYYPHLFQLSIWASAIYLIARQYSNNVIETAEEVRV
ncbi:MAG: hypothetical protein GY841_09175 [FCB group bacterium]|nr:hypothetical protein [FCB group bacterium]